MVTMGFVRNDLTDCKSDFMAIVPPKAKNAISRCPILKACIKGGVSTRRITGTYQLNFLMSQYIIGEIAIYTIKSLKNHKWKPAGQINKLYSPSQRLSYLSNRLKLKNTRVNGRWIKIKLSRTTIMFHRTKGINTVRILLFIFGKQSAIAFIPKKNRKPDIEK